jgi:O-methyltransferase
LINEAGYSSESNDLWWNLVSHRSLITRTKIVDFISVLDLRVFGYALRKEFFLRGLPDSERAYFLATQDPGRYCAFGLAIQRIIREGISGSFAEVGVYLGASSKVIHRLAPDRKMYLFDTFEGFPEGDLEGRQNKCGVQWSPGTFKSSVELVKQNLGDTRNVFFRKGYFPDTAKGLEDERFAFVNLDVDLHKPTLSGLEFFYPRMNRGGYMFVHDYSNPEANRGVSEAVDSFFKDKMESIVELPDAGGSIVVRKS